MRKMRVPQYCDDCERQKNCFVKAGLEGLKIVDCTNKLSTAPQKIAEAGDTCPQQRHAMNPSGNSEATAA